MLYPIELCNQFSRVGSAKVGRFFLKAQGDAQIFCLDFVIEITSNSKSDLIFWGGVAAQRPLQGAIEENVEAADGGCYQAQQH